MCQNKLIHKGKWDILLIIDACRYDYFQKYNTIQGKLRAVRSRGQNTPEWLIRTFKFVYDIAYVTANPLIGPMELTSWDSTWKGTEHFKIIDAVWKDGWDEELGTVTADTMIARVEEDLSFDKKVIAHFIQPHGPFIGKTKIAIGSSRKTRLEAFDIQTTEILDMPMFNHPLLKEGYRDNVKYVLECIKGFCERHSGEGRIVITSDHGEYLGEKVYGVKCFGHVFKEALIYDLPLLYKVPWFEGENIKG